jgi:multiple sugar transport system permease protein
MALPAFIISLTYGFAVNWNELFLTNAYLDGNIKTIPMLLQGLQANWGRIADYSTGSDYVNYDFTETKSFAGTILSIVPLVIMYGIVQRYFIESIDKSGIAGE